MLPAQLYERHRPPLAKRKKQSPSPGRKAAGAKPGGGSPPGGLLNRRAARLADFTMKRLDDLGVDLLRLSTGTTVLDFGAHAPGGLEAGIVLARLSSADLLDVSIDSGTLAGRPWPHAAVRTDDPISACLRCQYAGRKVELADSSGGQFFAMASGPLRAACDEEELIRKLGGSEEARRAVGVLETRQIPPPNVAAHLAESAGLAPDKLILCIAPTASLAGTVQIAARSVETALHKLDALGFDVGRVRSGVGSAPLAPAGGEDSVALGRTNDSILYGARVTLWIEADQAELRDLVSKVPSESSPQHGRPFAELLAEAGGNFYDLDPLLFSPAQVTLIGLRDGSAVSAGTLREDLLARSFGL
ncbi:methenyltetrahydromethanopterin cyclohydrolase [Alienimonas chondri]|uniref:Methenyltetrahydromethanopterin cyclohydrolase n=1 Tax=Alienimonas chondri TaxID=2681879 RepID=A0ABX1V6V3_9PLAN|nr:methenyltetrahydromethanopterin cyclohydrolase [Alienimonas chondri]NNJ23985.1 Methenyltetrahydromethanopterin cyclohydrolase [Alienimonas chondri]